MIANHFNKNVVNIGTNLVKNIPNSSSTFQQFFNHPCDNSIFLQHVKENETLETTKALVKALVADMAMAIEHHDGDFRSS